MHLFDIASSYGDGAPPVDRREQPAPSGYWHAIERYAGTIRVPYGLCGPLRVIGEHVDGAFLLPVATTEAALVASLTRGARAITEAGGASTAVTDDGMRRAPGFVFANLREAVVFARWVPDVFADLVAAAASTTRHGRLIAVAPVVEGNHVHLDLTFATGEAAGQNIVTFAAQAICDAIVARSPVSPRQVLIEANLSGDKKASSRAFTGGRGRRAVAEVRLAGDLVATLLKTSTALMVDCWRMNAVGAALSGAIGMQGHYANALAGLYLALGQDVACVAESAAGVTRMEDEGGTLRACVTLPNVIVGTVGGGTTLPDQHGRLAALGLEGPGSARGLAELCAALCLAGELSLCAAVAAGHFADAHRALARRGAAVDFAGDAVAPVRAARRQVAVRA